MNKISTILLSLCIMTLFLVSPVSAEITIPDQNNYAVQYYGYVAYGDTFQELVDYIRKTDPDFNSYGYAIIQQSKGKAETLVIGRFNDYDATVTYATEKDSNGLILAKNSSNQMKLYYNRLQDTYYFGARTSGPIESGTYAGADYYEVYLRYLNHGYFGPEGAVYLEQNRVYYRPQTASSNPNLPLEDWYKIVADYELTPFAKTPLSKFTYNNSNNSNNENNSSENTNESTNQNFTMSVTPSPISLKTGESKTVKVSISPYNSEILKTINFKDVDYNTISITPTGTSGEYLIRGLKAGVSSVTFGSSQYSNLKQTVVVTVTDDFSNGSTNTPGRNEPNILEVTPSVLNLTVGEEATLSYSVSSSGSDDVGTTNWNSEDPVIAASSNFYSEKASGTISIKAFTTGTTRILIINTKRSTENNEVIKTEKYVTVNVKAKSSSNNSSGSNSNNSNSNNSTSNNSTNAINIYRLYNNKTGEHLYTSDANEANTLDRMTDWENEGIGWKAPSSGSAVYRLYSPVTGVHLFTTDQNEVNVLSGSGWSVDNGGKPLFYSGGTRNVYRLYSPALRMHLITTDLNEYNTLAGQGWNQEGVKLKAY